PSITALAERFPIDGVVDFGVFDSVTAVGVEMIPFGGGSGRATTLRFGLLNDDRDLYVALEWDDPTHNAAFDVTSGPLDFDGVQLRFDADGDGVFRDGEDERIVIAAGPGVQYVDQHRPDTSDEIGDGFGRLLWDAAAARYRAEFLLPMQADARGQDGTLTASSRYQIVLFDHVQLAQGTGNSGAAFGGADDASSWPRLPLSAVGAVDRTPFPSDVGGLIAFVSRHEEPNGEVYTFDPATGVVRRVTRLPDLFKDNVSLSHDRTRVAFHGAPDRDAFTEYEIYTIAVDGTDLRRLTSNTILDGHPAWSPDDQRIAYASFRDPGAASIVVMNTDGTEIADLTPAGVDDNDPEYLPDGRIVFKTDRFQAKPQVQIAVMNEDGTGVVQLTRRSGVSDHDPVGNGTFTVFERFTRGTDFATDPESALVPWNIVRARLDGSGEDLLYTDGWVNWLPVYGPEGRYIAYLKSSGHTAVHLMTAEGRELGRLVPGITQMTYLDWK
ncbi:MAG: hypothetical protein D6701_06525, partial [Gemmatimonadetes bacterium]